ncbi:MAG: glycosyl hydrolase [Lentisphaeria bacterium]|nr:glycosyl hydrolase [Lentisphaeria bacterium]
MKEFKHPGSMYRGAPFWAWNNKLDADQLRRQIDCFKKMGLGGFHMHPRTGLDTEYLGDEFMAMIKACRDHAEKNGMLAWLYDEDRWPSGAAGGLVTKDERYRARHLLFTSTPYSIDRIDQAYVNTSQAAGARAENGCLLAAYDIEIKDGHLVDYRRLAAGEVPPPGRHVWYAYLETAKESSWFNNQTYVDTLNPEAIQKFVEVTHERYYQEVGESFGTTIPAIFTDEPQFVRKQNFARADEIKDVVMPWTTDLTSTFETTYGGDLLDYLPEVFWELPDGQASVWRYRYHDHVCERFTQAFSDTIGHWCDQHGIALTGHMMEEATLHSQTAALGESMRGYRSFQIPGIDVLCDRMDAEYATAKQAQSAAHQYGRTGVLSELYGVTNWDFDFAGHKRQGDWQAALGVTYRVHHLSMVSMAGEAKRDYPASINYQSPWCYEYPVVEDHFARVNWALTRGKPEVRVGVIHPVESYWLCWGPLEQTRDERDERDQAFKDLIQWLLYGFIDFDFISESLLPSQTNAPSHNGFAVGDMEYDVVLVPGMRTIRGTTLERLAAFSQGGGRVIFTGEIPSLVDAVPSSAPAALARRCGTMPFARTRLLGALAPVRQVELVDGAGVQTGQCLHQLRRDGNTMILFICNTHMTRGLYGLTVKLRGDWQAARMDTATGEIVDLGAVYERGKTLIPCDIEAHGSLLLTLTPGRRGTGGTLKNAAYHEVGRLSGPTPVSLSEPNVLVLDRAEFRVNDGDWRPKRHLLEIDPIIRESLGMPVVGGQMAQPWTDHERVEHAANVTLRFSFASRVDVPALELALENAAGTRIFLNGREVERKRTGYFVDEAIETIALPAITSGDHTLELVIDYTRKTYIEWAYLLGDFGVEVRGEEAVIVEPVRSLAFGDWTTQGLPFYAGNVTYHCALPAGADVSAVRFPHVAGPVLTVTVNDQTTPVAFAPFRAALGEGTAGRPLDITVFGNRVNAFGQLHSTVAKGHYWYGPTAWRSKGAAWADEYQLRPMGVLTAPLLENRVD